MLEQHRIFEPIRCMPLDRHIDRHGALKFVAQHFIANAYRVGRVKQADHRRVHYNPLRPEQAQRNNKRGWHPYRQWVACHAAP